MVESHILTINPKLPESDKHGLSCIGFKIPQGIVEIKKKMCVFSIHFQKKVPVSPFLVIPPPQLQFLLWANLRYNIPAVL